MNKLPEKVVVRVFFIDPLLNSRHKPSVSIERALKGESPIVVGYHDYIVECRETGYAIRWMMDQIRKDGGIYLDGVDGLTTFVPQSNLLPMIAGPESSFNAVPDVHHE